MAETRRWLLTYGTNVKNPNRSYNKVCNQLKQSIQNELSKQFSNPYFLDDNRDGESYSVRFMVEANYDLKLCPPSIGQINLQGKNYKIDLSES